MDGKKIRNVAIGVGVVALVIIALSLVSAFLTSVVPILITAVVAFVLGRMSVNMNLLDLVRRGRGQQSAAKPAEKPAAKRAQAPARADDQPAKAAEKPPKQVEVPVLPEADDADFRVKTVDDVLKESRRLEDEISQRNAAYDPTAALEERRRRLLGDQSGEQ
jgi:hypothetical protein